MRQWWMVPVAVLLSLAPVSLVSAGLEEGLTAYKAGDYGVAMKEWKLLAERGHAKAQYNVGILYEKGLGVPKDPRQAYTWYKKAAAQGLAFAQNNLGAMYEDGLVVETDYVEADMWYLLSAKQGNDVAMRNHKKLITQMSPREIAQARKRADRWSPSSAR